VRGDLRKAVQQLKQESNKGLLIQPRLAGHGPTLFAGLSKPLDVKLASRLEFRSGAVAMRYEPTR
jgi:hypothetical protein